MNGSLPEATRAEGAGRGSGPLLLGVRHHGPGSARAVRAALEAANPRTVLIEGPPEADALIALAAEEGMQPPVALLAHVVDEPGRSAFWPLAEFSPEWVAIRWALEHEVPARFIDLPATHTLAWGQEEAPDGSAAPNRPDTPDGPETPEMPETPDSAVSEEAIRIDPLAVLAETAGYDDPERWWEDVIEHRGCGTGTRSGPSRCWGRPWAPCGRCTGAGARAGSRTGGVYAAPSASGAAGVRGRRGRGVWGLACARPAAQDGRRRRQGTAEGPAQGEGGHDVGAVDAPAACAGQRLRRGDRLARLVRASVQRSRPADRALDDEGGRAAARRGPARLVRARHRGGAARRHARRDAG